MKQIYRFFSLAAASVLTISSASCSKTGSDSSGTSDFRKTDPESISFSWQDAYENKLSEFKASEQFTDDSAFDIFDITGDGIPELLISPDSAASTKCTACTIKNNELIEIGSIGSNGKLSYCPDTEMIKDEYFGNGFVLGKIISYSGEAFNTVLTYSDNSASASMGAVISHEINGEEVGLAEYEAALAPYSAAFSIEAGRRFTFGDSAVRYGLHCSESWQAILSPQQKELCRSKLDEVLQITSGDGTDPAFDLCDLNGDKVPELIISDGSNPEAECSVYYFSDGNLVQMDGKYGYAGIISFDTKAYVFFADKESGKTYWSIANAAFSSKDYTESDSIVKIGRKHLLTDSGISAVFN